MKKNIPTQLAYSVSGNGIPVVLLHGFCEDASMWDDVLDYGHEGIKFITIDLPGFGKSKINCSFSIAEMGAAVHQLILSMGIEKYFLFGHSMGGYVGLSLMEKSEAQLLGFGLLHSHPFADSDEQKVNRKKAIDFVKKFGSSLFIKQIIPSLFPKSFLTSNRFLLERLVFNANKYPALGITNALSAMSSRSDLSAVLRKMTIPFLTVIGEKDHLLPTADLLKQASMAKITKLHLVPRLGHMGPFENPKLINRAIVEFVATFHPDSE